MQLLKSLSIHQYDLIILGTCLLLTGEQAPIFKSLSKGLLRRSCLLFG